MCRGVADGGGGAAVQGGSLLDLRVRTGVDLGQAEAVDFDVRTRHDSLISSPM
jgi:hypothetical protein